MARPTRRLDSDGATTLVKSPWQIQNTGLASQSPRTNRSNMRSAPFEATATERVVTSPGRPDPAHAGQALRVLVVQNDEAPRRELEQAVQKLGHHCRSAQSGLDALALHEAEHADAILCDWDLPGIDGIELCRRTRSSAGDGPYTYFIFLTRLADKARVLQAIDAGADDYQVLPVNQEGLQMRLTSAGRVIGLYRKLAERNTALRRDSQASFLAARVDPLTQISNRLRMNEDLQGLWARARRYGHHYCAALCDIDWFKAYNDHFGHLEGDQVLVRVAQAIRDSLRQGDGLYRYGGEEFLVLLPEQPLRDACIAMDRVRKDVERLAIPTVGQPLVVTISIGVSELGGRDASLDDWLRRVDTALYRAKEKGRNRVEGETGGGPLEAGPASSPPLVSSPEGR
jgi:two-component system cell cycle response regulator